MMGGGDGLPGPTDAWVTLAGLARETTAIRLGTLVTAATFRLPGPLAITVAQVDEMSGGRVELGLGAGWYEAEHTAYGIPFPPLGERFDRLEEQLEIITGLWDHRGGRDVLASPAATTSVGGLTRRCRSRRSDRARRSSSVAAAPKRTPRLAATYAAGVQRRLRAPSNGSPSSASRVHGGVRGPRARPGLDRLLRRAGRLLRPDEAELARRADGHRTRAATSCARNGARRARRPRWSTRSAAAREVGAERIYLQVLDLADLDHLELIAAEVAPHVA